MKNMNPQPISLEEWREIIAVPAVRDGWGLTDDVTPSDFAGSVYAAKFDFFSGSPGYVGDLYILQGDALTGGSPLVLCRAEDGSLIVSNAKTNRRLFHSRVKGSQSVLQLEPRLARPWL
jgi:hypothetical protein